MRWGALALVTTACGVRTGLPVPECEPLAASTCRQLSVDVPSVTYATVVGCARAE
ncbi:MAG TPA: hypothetical protein VF316_24160 [Polyangiaceae bacterium]